MRVLTTDSIVASARILKWLAAVLALPATAALAAEFTIRLSEQPPDPASPVRISLVRACSSWECGAAWLEGRLPEAVLPTDVSLDYAKSGVFRGSTALDGGAWWVVVDGGSRMPVATLWRPLVVDGHFAQPPEIGASQCTVRVLDAAGAAVRNALVIGLPVNEGRTRVKPPSVVPPWRPWLSPTRTDARGIADLLIPRGATTEVRAEAPGRGRGAAACRPGSTATLRLTAESAGEFEVAEVGDGALLPRALVRAADGLPLAVADSSARVRLDPNAIGTGDLWVETPDGAVFRIAGRPTSTDAGERRLNARRLSTLRAGRVRLVGGQTPLDEIHVWREPEWPWTQAFHRVAAPTARMAHAAASVEALPEDRLWFAADGFGYGACVDRAPHRRVLGNRHASCPATLKAALTIEGVITDEAGTPIPDADVWIEWPGPMPPTVLVREHRGGQVLLRPGLDGRFRSGRLAALDRSLPGFPARNPFWSLIVRAESTGYLPVGPRSLDHFLSERGEVEITMTRGSHVSGRIVDGASGEPVGGVDVGIGRFASTGRTLLLKPLESIDPRGTGLHQLRFGRSDADGSFELTTWPGRHDLVARSPHHAFFTLAGVEVGAQGLDVGTIYLEAGRTILGQVIDQNRTPVPNAGILAAGAVDDDIDQEPVADAHPLSSFAGAFGTDSDGRFRIAGLGDDATVDLEISAPGFATERLASVAPTVGPPLVVVLEPEAVIEGRVTHQGAPVVTWVTLRSAAPADNPGTPRLSANTDDAGAFRFSGLAAGRYDVTASGQRELEDANTSLRAVAGDTAEVVLRLGEAHHQLAGRATRNGEGLGGVSIQAGSRATTTDASGRYALAGLAAGSHYVSATEPVSGPNERSLSLHEIVNISGRRHRLDFDFTAFEVSGRAIWGDGSSAAGVELSFRRQTDAMEFGVTAPADHSGRFTVRLVPGAYGVSSRRRGRWIDAEASLSVDGPRSDIRVRFPRSLAIRGAVLGLSAEEAAKLEIAARNDAFDSRGTRIEPDGSFRIDGVPPDAWTVRARLPGTGRQAERRVLVKDADVHVDLEFENLPRVRGTVLLDGLPYRGTPVFLVRGRELAGARRVWTRHDGAFSFPDVTPGEYTLGVGSTIQGVSVRSERTLTIELASGRIEGEMYEGSGAAPAQGAALALWPAAASRPEAETLGIVRRAFSDSSGRFAFEQVPEGAWLIEPEGQVGRPVPVTVAPGTSATVRFP